jgi:hypothetical protein
MYLYDLIGLQNMDEKVVVKQEPAVGDESVTITGNRENFLLSTDRKVPQFPPPLAWVDVKCEFQACFHFFLTHFNFSSV